MILKITKNYYVIMDLKFREICKLSKNNNVAIIKKQFNIIGFMEED